jgi:cellulose synthase/poly-beta-1,6-N-acetylglucosamine synthase-like glycosyltransferase
VLEALAQTVQVAYIGLIGLVSLYGLHRLVLLCLYWRHRAADPTAPLLQGLPAVTVQLPVYNEAAVVERLIEAVCALDWPADRLFVQVLDDSTDETVALCAAAVARQSARGVQIVHLRRSRREGYKAGALQAGLEAGASEVVAIFDADFVPDPSFLRVTVPHLLARPEVGMVQARWGHRNREYGLLTALSALLLDGHFIIEHTARNRSGRFFNFNGTAGVWRRACIEDAGGWQHDTLTEDLDLSYRAQLAGWRFVYLRDHVVPAELPDSLPAFASQQHRWAKGTLQTARKLTLPLLRAPLPLSVKMEALSHLYCNLTYPLLLVLAVLLPLVTVLPPLSWGDGLVHVPGVLLALGVGSLFYAVAAREADGRWGAALWRLPGVVALGVGMSLRQSRAVVEGLFGQDRTFVRTPKRGDGGGPVAATPIGAETVVELGLAGLYGLVIAWSLAEGRYGNLPFLLLMAAGFGGVGLGSLRRG